jgi:hypothetical protein
MLSKGVIVGSKKRSGAVIEPKHGVNGSGAPSSIGLVAEVSPQVKLSLLRKRNPKVLRAINVVVLASRNRVYNQAVR